MTTATDIDPKELPYLGRCSSCEYALRATVDEAQPVERYREMEETGKPYRMGAQLYVRCPNRHKPFKLYALEYTHAEGFTCDARCENARGHICKCSCGGMNHGLSHAVGVVHVASEAAQSPPEPYKVEVGNLEPPARPEPAEPLLGTVGEALTFRARVVYKKDLADSTLYVFRTLDYDNSKLTWFAPSFANPDWPVGFTSEFTGKVKKHEDGDYGKNTIVTYVEQTEEAEENA